MFPHQVSGYVTLSPALDSPHFANLHAQGNQFDKCRDRRVARDFIQHIYMCSVLPGTHPLLLFFFRVCVLCSLYNFQCVAVQPRFPFATPENSKYQRLRAIQAQLPSPIHLLPTRSRSLLFVSSLRNHRWIDKRRHFLDVSLFTSPFFLSCLPLFALLYAHCFSSELLCTVFAKHVFDGAGTSYS